MMTFHNKHILGKKSVLIDKGGMKKTHRRCCTLLRLLILCSSSHLRQCLVLNLSLHWQPCLPRNISAASLLVNQSCHGALANRELSSKERALGDRVWESARSGRTANPFFVSTACSRAIAASKVMLLLPSQILQGLGCDLPESGPKHLPSPKTSESTTMSAAENNVDAELEADIKATAGSDETETSGDMPIEVEPAP